MQGLRLRRWGLATLTILSLVVLTTTALAELKPGDRLDSTNCQEAKGMLPEHVMEKFCAGQYAADIVEVKDEAYRYSAKFRAGTEANAGKYYVNDDGYMYETATHTWPRHWYGLPFPQIDENDPKAAYKVMYNAQMTRFQYDDTYWFLSLKWATPTGFDRMVDFGVYATPFIGRHSGPIDNPDDCYLKDIIFGVAPYDVVGVSTLEWWYTDPEKWQSIWAFVPTIRRVRRVTAANTSEGIFGSILARDDPFGWAGKIQYMNWKLIGIQDILVPIAPGGMEKAVLPGDPAPKKLPGNPDVMIRERAGIPVGQVGRVTYAEEERMKVGYETPGWQGVAWAPAKMNLAKRRCWVVEATPKDPYYAYGRRIVYLNRVVFWGYWATLYDRAGEYWKTIMWFDKMSYTPGREQTTKHPFWGLGEDVRQNRASFFDVQSKGYYTEYSNGFPDSTYTTGNQMAIGK